MSSSTSSTEQTSTSDITINVAWCKYGIVRDAVMELNYSIIDDQEDDSKYNCKWLDVGVGVDKVMALGSHAKINHWPGMSCLHTKNGLAATLRPLQRLFPKAFGHVHPRTWLLPEEMADFQTSLSPDDDSFSGEKRQRKKVFIVKPAASCQGRGIHLVRSLHDLQDPRSASIAQEYEARPFLIEGLKFDLRIYVLLSSVDPLRIWLFDEGLVRFATTPYSTPKSANLKNVTQHLTNYAINKDSERFVQNSGGIIRGDVGSKRTLSWFRTWLDANGYSSTRVWGRIVDLINKVFIAGQPHLARTYRSAVPAEGGSMRCFEVLGLDVLLDSKLNPWMLEVNHSPSLSCDSQLDTQIKIKLIKETLQMLRLRPGDLKRANEVAAAAAKRRLYGGSGISTSISTSSESLAASTLDTSTTRTLSKSDDVGIPSKRAHAFRELVTTVLKENAKNMLLSGISSVDTTRKFDSPPAHAEATAPLFVQLATPIPEEHAQHEAKVCRGYRLIFPPPNPAFLEDSVFDRGAAGAKIMQDAMKRAKERRTASKDDDGSDDEVEDKVSRSSDLKSKVSRSQSATEPITSLQTSQTREYNLAKPSVFRVFYVPWDTSRVEYDSRIQRYAYYLAAAQELYALNNAASAIGGKKAGEATVLSSISAMSSAVSDIDVESEGISIHKEVHVVVLPGLETPRKKETEFKTVSLISRNLRALSVAAAERAASTSTVSKRSLTTQLPSTPGLNVPAWDSGKETSESTIANRILTALRNLARRDSETQSAMIEARERLEADDLKARRVSENVVVVLKQEDDRPPPNPPPPFKRTFDADLALVSKRSALIRAASTASNASFLAASSHTVDTSRTRPGLAATCADSGNQLSSIAAAVGAAKAAAANAVNASPIVGIASVSDVGPIGFRDTLIPKPKKGGFRGMTGMGLQRSIGPSQLVNLVVPSPNAHAAYKRLVREATGTQTARTSRHDEVVTPAVELNSPVKKSLINAVRPLSASSRIGGLGGASANEVLALLQQTRVARSADLFKL